VHQLEIKVLNVVQNFAASVYGYMSDVLVGEPPESLCTYKYFVLMTDDGKFG